MLLSRLVIVIDARRLRSINFFPPRVAPANSDMLPTWKICENAPRYLTCADCVSRFPRLLTIDDSYLVLCVSPDENSLRHEARSSRRADCVTNYFSYDSRNISAHYSLTRSCDSAEPAFCPRSNIYANKRVVVPRTYNVTCYSSSWLARY